MNQQKIENAVKTILKEIGENPNRPGLIETPNRVYRMFKEIFAGYEIEKNKTYNYKLFKNEIDGIVTIKDIPTYSVCEHHLMPMFGTTTVQYKTKNKTVIGLSKIPRLVKAISQKLQIQEKMTNEIADLLFKIIKPKWVKVEQDLRHMCVEMRGAKCPSSTHTFKIKGDIKDYEKTKGQC